MKKNYSLKLRAVIAVCLFFVYNLSFGQTTTVFNDDFTTPNASVYTIAVGPVSGSSTWTMSRSGADFASAISGGRLIVTNDGSNGSNSSGWVLASTSSTSNFAAPFTATLANNPGAVTWSFNLRQTRTNPSGFAAGVHGTGFILAGTAGSTNVTGTGYAIILGNSGTTDPVRLVRYSSGLRTFTTLTASSTTGLADFGTQYLSIRVVYTPGTHTWQLFVRNDGTTAFADPNTGTLTAQPATTSTSSTYTNTPLTIMGGAFNGGTVADQTAFFDNIRVTVGIPFITSIAPTSRIAGSTGFTLTVNGQNFLSTSVVQWNGSPRTTTYVSPTQLTVAIPASDIVTSGTALVTVTNGTTVSNSNVFTIDPAGLPTLTTSTSTLNIANTVTGSTSVASTYTITGVNLTSDPIITAPANFEISSNGTNFFPSITLPRTGNNLAGGTVTISVRTTAAAAPGTYSGTVTNAVTGGTTKNVSVSGKVLATQPTTLSAGLGFTGITSTSFTANWTSGNGARRLVIVRQAGAVNSLPIDGQSYTASGQFGVGSEIGTGNFVVYSGTGNSAVVTGLLPSTVYHISVVEYNGSTGTENYTASGLTGNTTTLATPVGWQIYTTNAVNTINFDTTVDGVNADAFQGDGLATPVQTGQLNSGAWAFTGFSDGAVAFGATSPEDSDYDQGISSGGTTDTGLYAFETQPDNSSLGIQPGTGDFAPGTVTLKFQNRTGAAITSLNIGYKVYIYNDQASSSSFNFSYSANNSAYTAVPIINTISPAAADGIPQWKGYYRVTTIIPAVSIANGADYYLRWSSATVSGSVDFDEFALDDISVVANPSTVFAPFSGTAETFVLDGNATMSGNLDVVGNLSFNNNAKLGIASNTLTLNGSITNTSVQGIKGGSTSNLIVGGTLNNVLSFDQTTVGATNLLNNLTIATTAPNTTTTLGTALAVNGTLTIENNQILNMGANALTGTLSAPIVNGTLQTSNTTATPLPAGKIWSGSGTVHYNATSTAQTVVMGTYNGLVASSTAGAVAGGALTVNGILNLPTANPSATTGSLSMGSYELLMGGAATNTGIGDVTGDVIRTSIVANVLYTFGHKDTSIIFPAIGTLPSVMGLRIQIGAAPSWLPGAILRKYDFKETGGANTKAIIKAHYLDSELNGNNEANLVDWAHIIATSTTLEQGRSNYNTTENWVELTNVNVGVFFQPNFGQVELTLDEYAAGVLTWNGSSSNSWTTATNWTPNGVPSSITTVIIPDAATTTYDPTINPTTEVGKLNINVGGIVNAPAGSQFNIYGAGGAWINNGTFNPLETSTVAFVSLDATIAGETTFNNITINAGAGLRPQTGNIMHISGVFNRIGIFSPGAVENTVDFTGTGQTVPQLTTGLLAYNNLTITGSGAILPTPLNITGNLRINNTVDFTGRTVVMKGTTPQSILGTANPAFDNLSIENGTVTLGVSSTINGTLTLTSGQLIVDTTILTLVNAVAGAPFDATKMIATGPAGEVRIPFAGLGSYLFPIGENTTPAYSPITIDVTAGTFGAGAYVGAKVADGLHPSNYSLENHLSRYWTVNQANITGAVATINANFIPADASATVSTIAAAQLTGTFNQATNPWIKYGQLSGSPLVIVGAPLTAGQPNVFTGIKDGVFSVDITGFGAFCENEVVTLTAATSGGDPAYVYAWSGGLGSQATATPPTNIPGTISYTITVRDANGIVATDTEDVTVLTPSLGGTPSASQNVCLRTEPGDILLTGYTGNVLYWQRSEDPTFATGVTNISNITDTLTGEDTGVILATTYFRAVISNGNCGEVYSGITSAIIQTTTWNGSTWSNGTPGPTTNVIVTGDTIINADFEACSVTIENNANITITSGVNFIINGALIINSGSFMVENNASLVQTNNSSQNAGTNFTMKRITEPMYRYDLTYWSSPVAGQTLKNLSPLTLFDKYFGWDPNSQTWITYPVGNHTMQPGAGYVVRAPQNYSTDPTVVQPYEGNFIGTPYNGIFTVPVVGDGNFNLLGNPYPSAIDADLFLSDPANATLDGVIYLWTHNTPIIPAGQIYSYSTDDYAVYNFLGGTGTAAPSEPNANLNVPNGYIASGQGFFIGGITAGIATFHNGMRVAGNNDQFFRSPQVEKHRLWTSISNASGGFKQILIGHASNATNDFDRGWDGSLMDSDGLTLYTFVEDRKLSIQSFALPFDVNQTVPVGYKTDVAGSHSIMINKTDGLFAEQDIYLHDKALDLLHDLKVSNYEFTTQAGTFDNRFEIVYVNAALGNPDGIVQKGILIYNDENTISVKSAVDEISTISIIDMQGRILYTLHEVNDNKATLKLDLPNQVLIVSVTTKDGSKYNKKIIQ